MFKLDIPSGLRVIFVGALSNLALSVIKFLGGVFGHSAALISDAVHSISDLLTDTVALFTYQIGRLPRDYNHPYGHRRAESIGAAVIGLFILLAGLGIGWESLHLAVYLAGWPLPLDPLEPLLPVRRPPTWVALAGALLSLGVKEWLFHYTRHAGEKENSPTLVANAWHHRSDAISSVAALIGIGAAMAGYPLMDPLAGLVVALIILRAGYQILREGTRDLMDTSLEESELERIHRTILSTPGVLRAHELRTRRMGGEVFMDVHVLVDRECSVTEGHQVAETVRRRLLAEFEAIQDVVVHIDTEDDYRFEPVYPVNSEELKKLADPVIAATPGILTRTRFRVHFHTGRIVLEVFLRPEPQLDLEQIRQVFAGLRARLLDLPHVNEVRLYVDLPLD